MLKKSILCSLGLLVSLCCCFLKAAAQGDFYETYKETRVKIGEGKYDEALSNNLKALEAAEKLGNNSFIAYANIQVGNVYYYLRDKHTAIKWYMKAAHIIEGNSIDTLKADLYHNTSVMYNELHVTDSAMKYEKKAINILRMENNYHDLSQALSTISDVYIYQLKDYKTGLEVINEATKFAHLAKDEGLIAFSKTKRAQLFAKQNCFKEALNELISVEPIYRKNKQALDLIYFFRLKSLFSLKTGDNRGYQYLDTLLVLKDSIFRQEIARKTGEYDALYRTEKKERENKILQQENNLQQAKIDSRNKTIIGLIVLILLIIAIVAWRVSVINLRKKEAELKSIKDVQKEKERISRDLHDNVGGQLSYVLYSLDDIASDDKGKRLELSKKINDSIRAVISSLRETIWAINDEEITVNDFSDKLKVYARNMFKNTNTQLFYSENITQNSTLNSTVGLNLYRICQEVINNCFKHAHASEVKITIATNNNISISISDNGKGFNLSENYNDSYGLSNINARAIEANIVLDIRSDINKGTSYTLVV